MRLGAANAEKAMVPQFADELFAEDVWKASWSPSSAALTVEPVVAAGLLAESARVVCGQEGCASRSSFWKKSGRPVFDGRWVCSSSCAKHLVGEIVRRQNRTAKALEETGTHRHRIPLGLLLVDLQLVTPLQLQCALEAQRAAGRGLIGDWLMDICGVSPEKITKAVAAQWNRPVLSNVSLTAESMALTMPAVLRQEARMAPLRLAGGKILYAAFAGAVDYAASVALERMNGVRVECGLLSQIEFSQTEVRLDAADSVECRELTFEDSTDLVERVVKVLFQTQPVASKLVPVHGKWWLRMWLERQAWGARGPMPKSPEDVLDVVFRST
ncbi:MAG: hypothetical protein PW792_07190 [Acidobacteriaceae bacterium]|nr:hypothetical protein [Acidobacteriaceae bacterium]